MVKVREDLTGRQFDHLTVIQQTVDYISKNGTHYAQWLCQCDCGNPDLIVVRGDALKNKHTTSCGCVKSNIAKEVGLNNKKECRYDLSGEYGILWLNNTNEECYFDLEDANKILQYSWWNNGHGYAQAKIGNHYTTMHQFLGYKWYDHKDRNKLNNQKSNFRPCTIQENCQNMSIRKDNTSGFTGVSWDKESEKWLVQINVNKKRKKIGRFINKEDAIIARLRAEKKYFGEFAPQRHLFEKYGIT